MVKLHQRQGQLSLEAGDSEWCVVELNVFLMVRVWGVIAGEDFQRAIADTIDHRLPVLRAAQGRVHFKICVIDGPFGAMIVRLQVTAILRPEMFAAADGSVCQHDVVNASLTRDRHTTFLGLANQLYGFPTADVLAVDVCARQLRQLDVARHDQVLAARGPALEAQQCAPVAFVHHTVSDN